MRTTAQTKKGNLISNAGLLRNYKFVKIFRSLTFILLKNSPPRP
jgi:hypothetical protein